MKSSRRSQLGFGMLEVMFVVGIIAISSLAILGLVTNLSKSSGAALKNANRIEGMRAIATALANKATCSEALGGGTLTVPVGWGGAAPLTINNLTVGPTVLAATGQLLSTRDVRVTGMSLRFSAGPETVKRNVAATGAPPDIRDYRRYLANLVVSLQKVGGAANNVGGDSMKDSEFMVSILVNDSNRLIECFSATNTNSISVGEAVIDELCEGAFEGEFNATLYPWCTINRMAVGLHVNAPLTFPPKTGRLIVAEQPFPTNPIWDSTVLLVGASGGNGPGIHWFGGNTTDNGVIGFANQDGRYGNHVKKGDLSISAVGNTSSVHLVPLSVADATALNTRSVLVARNDGIVVVGDSTKANNAWKADNDLNRGVLATFAEDGRWALMGSNTTAVNEYGMAFGRGSGPKGRTGAFFHSNAGVSGRTYLASYANQDLTIFTDPANNGIWTTTMNFKASTGRIGIFHDSPQKKLHVGDEMQVDGIGYFSNDLKVFGSQAISGHLTVAGNVTVSGTVTASSDRRLKRDIQSLDHSLDKILNIDPVSFYFKDKKKSQSKQVGFVAQDLEQVIPEVVETGKDGYKSVAYGNIIAVVVGAMKEMYEKLLNLIHQSEEQSSSRFEKIENQMKEILQKQKELEAQNKILEERLKSCQR